MMKEHLNTVLQYVRERHASCHGIRKGGATHVTTGTTVPPPIPSIAGRGEWSMGKVLDVYWHFAEPGDNYLGRCIVGIDPSDPKFASLPPHWTVSSPLENEHIAKAMKLLYAPILEKWGGHSHSDPIGLLLFILPSMIHHIDWIVNIASSESNHPFATLPLLQEPDLIIKLKKLVTLKPTEVMPRATGIPPHVETTVKLKALLDLSMETLRTVQMQGELIEQSIKKAFEEKAIENGVITSERILQILSEFQEKMLQNVGETIRTVSGSSTDAVTNNENNQFIVARNQSNGKPTYYSNYSFTTKPCQEYQMFMYVVAGADSFAWSVPKSFSFPATNIRNGFFLWLRGMPSNTEVSSIGETISHPIAPFCSFQTKFLPKPQRNSYKLKWRPIFKVMMEIIEDKPPSPTVQEVEDMYKAAITHLKERISYCFAGKKGKANARWTTGTWSKHVNPGYIRRYGTEEDIARIPEFLDEDRYGHNRRAHAQRRTVHRTLQQSTRVARRNH